MSNKKASPVRWLDVMIGKMEQHGADLPALRFHIDKALQMESQKQEKYDEMVDFINRVSGEMLRNDFVLDEKWYEQARQLIKEAKEL
jgi:hypothetical protein